MSWLLRIANYIRQHKDCLKSPADLIKCLAEEPTGDGKAFLSMTLSSFSSGVSINEILLLADIIDQEKNNGEEKTNRA